MSVFGLDETDVATAVDAVRGGHVQSASEVQECVARAAWHVIAEPGDGMAGHLIATLGAVRALTVLLAGRSAQEVAAEVRERSGEPDELGRPIAEGMARWRPRLTSPSVLRSIELAGRLRAALLLPGDETWPTRMDDLGEHAPILLWWRGGLDPGVASERAMAVVGSRAATGYGEHVAAELASGLVDRGITIVSGAAYGIDGMAHRAALASQGNTVAYLAGGVDRFYPAGHDGLLGEIVDRGAVVSEVPCGTAPARWRFLQRNRLIAAGSAATVVVEAGRRSGSNNTAGHAAELGRPLGAVPGPITSASSVGCHRLLREFDAVCVTSAADAAELIDGPAEEEPGRFGPRDDLQIRVLDALSTRSQRDVLDVARRAGLAATSVLGALGALELDGAVRQADSGWLAVPRRN
jgi:DNA protecting protein DprA